MGVSVVDGSTDAQGRSDLTATVCLGETCRTVALAAEPSQRGVLVAGFAELPLSSADEATVRVTVTRGTTSAGKPYDVVVHPVAPATPTAGVPQGCPAGGYVASVVVDAFGAHEAPPPHGPSST